MTDLLERALAELAKPPEQNQDAIAARILEEIEDERHWDDSFARSQDVLAAMAREERRRGETLPLDIAQEATHNTVKHACASQITMRLECDADDLRLEVREGGTGFDPPGDFPVQLGVRSMREHVTRLGGTLHLESAPGQGTTISVRAPVRQAT